MRKLLFIPFILILIYPLISLSEWTEVVTNKAGNTYVDFNSIKKVDEYIFFWALTDFLKPLDDEYFSSIVFHQIDCKSYKYKDINMTFYKEPMGKGDVLHAKPPEHWHSIEEKTTIGSMIKLVCKYIKHATDLKTFNAL